jgi:hypothetical protein
MATASGQFTMHHDAGDPLGPVNHAVYVHDFEVARLEAMAAVSLPFAAILKQGYTVVASDLFVQCKTPAFADDLLDIQRCIAHVRGARMTGSRNAAALTPAHCAPCPRSPAPLPPPAGRCAFPPPCASVWKPSPCRTPSGGPPQPPRRPLRAPPDAAVSLAAQGPGHIALSIRGCGQARGPASTGHRGLERLAGPPARSTYVHSLTSSLRSRILVRHSALLLVW